MKANGENTPADAGTMLHREASSGRQRRLQWTIHLARRRPGRALAALVIVAAGAVAAAVAFQGLWAGILAAVLLVGAIGDFLFPVRYTLNAEGAQARGLVMRRRIAWRQVRRVARDRLGVKISPLPRPSRLEAYRGIYLWFENNADEVMEFIARHTEAVGGDDRRSAESVSRDS